MERSKLDGLPLWAALLALSFLTGVLFTITDSYWVFFAGLGLTIGFACSPLTREPDETSSRSSKGRRIYFKAGSTTLTRELVAFVLAFLGTWSAATHLLDLSGERIEALVNSMPPISLGFAIPIGILMVIFSMLGRRILGS